MEGSHEHNEELEHHAAKATRRRRRRREKPRESVRVLITRKALAGLLALVTLAAGTAGALLKSWILEKVNGPAQRVATIQSLTVSEINYHPGSVVTPYWWVIRVRYETDGLHGRTIAFVPWLYDAATQARPPRLIGWHGEAFSYQPRSLTDTRPVTAQDDHGLELIHAPIPVKPCKARYYIGVAVFVATKTNGRWTSTGQNELDYKTSSILQITPQKLKALNTTFHRKADVACKA